MAGHNAPINESSVVINIRDLDRFKEFGGIIHGVNCGATVKKLEEEARVLGVACFEDLGMDLVEFLDGFASSQESDGVVL